MKQTASIPPEAQVPAGWQAIREDFALYARVHQARSRWAKARMLLTAKPLWALAVYRFGRAAQATRGPMRRPLQATYAALFHVVHRLSKVSMPLGVHVEEGVWLGSAGPIILSPGSRLREGAALHGGNTLGIGGRPGARGVPHLGRGATLSPGAAVIGPIELPDATVIGPNTVVTRSLPHGGPWLGAPAKPFEGDAAQLLPAVPS